MRNKPILLIVITILLGAGLFVPSAAAATWASISDNQISTSSSGNGNFVSIVKSPTSNSVILFYSDQGDFMRQTCSTTSCGSQTIMGSAYGEPSSNRVGQEIRQRGNEVIGCYFNAFDATKAPRWLFSNDDGASFSQGNIKVGGNSTSGCGIDSIVPGQWRAVFMDDANNTIIFAKTDNYGIDWAYSTLVTGNTQGATGIVTLAVKNSTEYGVVYMDASSNLRFCRTTNSGSSWACNDTGILAAVFPFLRVNDDAWFLSYTVGGGTTFLAKSTTDGALWASSTVDATNAGTGRREFHIFNSTTIYISHYNLGTGPVGSIYTSHDLGTTWAEEEMTDCDNTVGTSGATASGTSVFALPTGDVWVSGTQRDGSAVFLITCHASDLFAETGATTPINAAATVTVTNLVGFDVDKLGTVLIARTDGGSHVSTYDTSNLGAAGGPVDTNCNQFFPRVFAQHVGNGVLTAYVQCSTDEFPGASIRDPTHLHIRTSTLNTPSDEQLNGAGIGSATVSLDGFTAGGGDWLDNMAEISAYPISYREQEHVPFSTARTYYLAWGWSSGAETATCDLMTDSGDEDRCRAAIGKIGTNAFSNHQSTLGVEDDRRTSEVSFATGPAQGHCTGTDEGQVYIAATGNDGPGKTYVIQPTFTDKPGTALRTLNFTTTLQTVFSSSLGTAGNAIACGSGLVAIGTGTSGVHVLDRSGSLLLSVPFTNSADCVALSEYVPGAGQYVSYCNADDFEVRQILNQTGVFTNVVVGEGPSLGGTIRDMAITRAAQALFIGNQTVIAKYTLGGAGVPIVSETGEDTDVTVTPAPTTPTRGLVAVGPSLEEPLGIPDGAGNFVLGLIIVIVLAVASLVQFESHAAGFIGAMIGSAGAWKTGLWDAGVLFLIALGVAVVLFLVAKRG